MMKKIVLQHPVHETDLETFVGKVEKEDRFIISVPSESFSVEMFDGKIAWGFSSLFGHPDARADFERQLKKELREE